MTARRRSRHKRPRIRPLRASVAAAVALALALLLGLQATSSVLTKKNPPLAARLFPLNGQALEQVVRLQLASEVKSKADIVPVARRNADLARRALELAPLTPEAHAVAAIAEADPVRSDAIFDAATSLNRRDALLQGLLLERQAARKDYSATLTTLDRLLRVNPEQTKALLPVLATALRNPQSLPSFARILDGSSRWHPGFLQLATADDASLVNLATLRPMLKVHDDEFDRLLILRLAREGHAGLAYGIYQEITGQARAGDFGAMAWAADYPPFDWSLADDVGLRAQPTQGGKQLEIFVRSGQGGLLAQRLIKPPAAGFVIRIVHALTPKDQVRDVRLQLRCNGVAKPFLEERFAEGGSNMRIDRVPSGCDYATIAIHARAWSGRSPIRGAIAPLQLVSQPAAAR